MVVIAEIFLSAFFTVLLEKLASGDLFNLALPEGIYSRLHTWTSKLGLIEAVLSERRGEANHGETDLAYDLDDLLEQLAAEALRRKPMMAQPTQASNPSMFRKLIPACCSTNFTPRAVQFDFNISSEIDNITERLQGLLEKKSTSSRRTGDERPPSTSLVDEYSGFYGREKDKQAILAQMGLGSESGSNLDDRGGNFKDLEKVQVKLREIISKKKFLLILDDVWNEKYGKWDVLSRPFQAGAPGSTVIVTTRNVSVASIMRSVPDYHLEQLGMRKFVPS
ncbi:hypothetical protein RJ639_022257 [Escallonia herrerae]|uniref:NB-ARC domain-containing protein n=1 Tax=Escallonia herrerae TaxID=1293975 RepID=A0AA88V727_9ASTE|nr:hypothetical protein RJ639_022257 [Escallonia herrerae]